jgi:DNA mismatch repair protein MutS
VSATRTPAARAAQTPLMRQYLRLKNENQDAFLFFRLGDFYEMFFEDAVKGAALLGLTLTSRNKSDAEPIPMCGIPWHQRDAYVGRLLRLGHKVAICDQLEEPGPGKALVERGVTEILTPGSITADSWLEPSANNFLGALWPETSTLGTCLVDASTGEIRLAEPGWDEAAVMLSRVRAAEWLIPAAEDLDPRAAARLEAALSGLAGARSPVPLAKFLGAADVLARWGSETASEIGDLPAARVAAGAALEYLERMQGGRARHLTRVERWRDDTALRYDAATARHLELFQPQPGGEVSHTMWHHLDRSVTAIGSRRLRAWLERPLVDRAALERRLDQVQEWFADASGRGRLREALRMIPDLERLTGRLGVGKATPRDLGAIRAALEALPGVQAVLSSRESAVDSTRALNVPGELLDRLKATLVDEPPIHANEGGIIRTGFDADRDRLDDLAHSGKRWVADLEETERARTGISSLKVGFNRVFGYYLEVTRPHLDKVPASWERRQTLTTAERFVTMDLKQKEGEILSAEDRLKAREQQLFNELREFCAGFVNDLMRAATELGRLDAVAALAEAASLGGWVRPVIEDSDRLVLENARHPVVDRLLPRGEFVPNSCVLDSSARQILLLTGPNMGGKSTYLRQVALCVLLAQTGSFVPAESAVVGLVDRLFTRVGAGDRLGAGQSTFMVEMSETAEIMRSATPRSLVILDEVGRGTATYDGLALAWAVTEHLHAAAGPRPRTMFATHYHELTQLAATLPRLANVHVQVKEQNGKVVFLHRIADGAADRSYGIHVAELAGLPASVIARAHQVLAELESERTALELGPPAPVDTSQLSLFGASDPVGSEVRAEMSALDPDAMTPREALAKLAEWKERWGKS